MLQGVHPDLILVVSRGLLYSPYDFVITEGVRNLERQAKLVADGFSKTMDSRHLVQLDGYGRAIDIMAVGDLNNDHMVDHQDKSLTWDRGIYSFIAGGMKKASVELGIPICWGGDFKSKDGQPFFDGPHFELL